MIGPFTNIPDGITLVDLPGWTGSEEHTRCLREYLASADAISVVCSRAAGQEELIALLNAGAFSLNASKLSSWFSGGPSSSDRLSVEDHQAILESIYNSCTHSSPSSSSSPPHTAHLLVSEGADAKLRAVNRALHQPGQVRSNLADPPIYIDPRSTIYYRDTGGDIATAVNSQRDAFFDEIRSHVRKQMIGFVSKQVLEISECFDVMCRPSWILPGRIHDLNAKLLSTSSSSSPSTLSLSLSLSYRQVLSLLPRLITAQRLPTSSTRTSFAYAALALTPPPPALNLRTSSTTPDAFRRISNLLFG